MKKTGMYIHIPFCKAKCKYCDFVSFSGMEQSIPLYFTQLEKELIKCSIAFKEGNKVITSIFIGGGTPTCVRSEYIVRILEVIYDYFQVQHAIEVTIEANPGTVNYASLLSYKKAGINRISFGLQACQKDILQFLGRIHSYDDFIKSYNDARIAGFDNINVDLMFGIPGQKLDAFTETIDNIVELNPEHISAYSLIIEPNTVFETLLESGKIKMIDDIADREMNDYLLNSLSKKGYTHYEISNFSKPDKQCIHNMIYWNCDDYLGVGVAAHSFIDGVRHSNITDINEYINKISMEESIENMSEIIIQHEQMQEFMMLGFRKIEGPDIKEFYNRFGCTVSDIFSGQICKLISRGLIEGNEVVGYKLTKQGLDLGNLVFMEFCGE